jgi:hypothetical protein
VQEVEAEPFRHVQGMESLTFSQRSAGSSLKLQASESCTGYLAHPFKKDGLSLPISLFPWLCWLLVASVGQNWHTRTPRCNGYLGHPFR